MNAALVVPLAGFDDPNRTESWRWLRRRYETLHPRLDVWPSVGRIPEHGFVKAEFVNPVVEMIIEATETLVVADADCVVDARALGEALGVVGAGESWAVPFRDVYRLNESATARVRSGPVDVRPAPVERAELDPERPMYRGKPGGGVVVVRRAVFEAIGGFDERFVGWGGEDVALGHALRAICGPPHRAREPLWHLWHRPAPGYDFEGRLHREESRVLAQRYRRAAGDADTMRALLAERDATMGR